MQTPPLGWLATRGTFMFPVPPAAWFYFATQTQAQTVLDKMNALPGASLSLQNGTKNGQGMFFVAPPDNPDQTDIWEIVGSVPDDQGNPLPVREFAGDLWDSGGVAPFGGVYRETDYTGPSWPAGGANLIYRNLSGGAQFFWSGYATPLKAVNQLAPPDPANS